MVLSRLKILQRMCLPAVGQPVCPVLLSHQDAFLGKKEMAVSRLTSVTLLDIYFRYVEHGMERMV